MIDVMAMQQPLLVEQQASKAHPPRIKRPILNSDLVSGGMERLSESGMVTLRVLVTKEGYPTHCEVTETSSSPAFDDFICVKFMNNVRFEPAQDKEGASVPQTFYQVIKFTTGGAVPPTSGEIQLKVRRLPAAYHGPVKTRLIFDGTGHVSECEVSESSGSVFADKAACKYFMSNVVMKAPHAQSIKIAPAALRTISAEFIVDDTAP